MHSIKHKFVDVSGEYTETIAVSPETLRHNSSWKSKIDMEPVLNGVSHEMFTVSYVCAYVSYVYWH